MATEEAKPGAEMHPWMYAACRALIPFAVVITFLPLTVPGFDVQAQEVGIAVGAQGPDAVVHDLEGNELNLLALADGKPLLLEFWASWCENCHALQPQLDEIQANHGDDIQIVAVAVAVSQSLRRVKRHAEEENHGYPFVWDATGAAVRGYEALTTSVVVVLDENGVVTYTGVGGDQDLAAAVGTVLP